MKPIVSPCIAYDGPDGTWQERVVSERWIELGIEPVMYEYPESTCGTKQCMCLDHLEWHLPSPLNYPPGVCVYCGMLANTRDHLLPRTWTGNAQRSNVLVVPACRECNSAISDQFAPSITGRRETAHAHIRRKHKKLLASERWTKRELRELGTSLRTYIQRSEHDRLVQEARLAWPEDHDYDLRAIQKSGIDDPYAAGLIYDTDSKAA